MKYENFKEIQNLVNSIERHRLELATLDNYNVCIKITSGCQTLYTIGVDYDSEHDYKEEGTMFIDAIKHDLRERIKELKAKLELL